MLPEYEAAHKQLFKLIMDYWNTDTDTDYALFPRKDL